MRRFISSIVGLLLAIVVAVSAVEDKSFVVENVKRTISLVSPHGVDVSLAFKATKKDAAASAFLITIPSENQAGRIAKVSCSEAKEGVKEVQVEKSEQAVSIKVPVTASFSTGTFTCQV